MDEYLKKRKIKLHFKEDIEPQEVLLDNLAQKKEEEIGVSEKKFEVPLPRRILQFFLVFNLILIFVLFGKTFQLQVIEGENLSALAEGNKFIIHSIRAERGVIYDKNLNQLVFNQPSFDLILDTRNLLKDETEKSKILKEVSEIIKEDLEDLKKKISETPEPIILVSENLDHQTLIILETRINELTGFRIERNSVRYYPNGESLAHLIGYTGKITAEELKNSPEIYSIFDYVGRDGIEKSYEETLRKNPGKLRLERDALGNIISKEVISLPESGKSLVLWLDSELQQKITKELEKGLKAVGAKKGAAVVLDPKTGSVLSLVSLHSFDNNLFSKGADPEALGKLLNDPKEPLFNRAISGGYATGSTIKPLIALAALEEKIIKPDKLINDDKGYIEIPHRYNPEIVYIFRDWKVHGWTDMRKAIAESCNVYFYTIGGGYGDQEGLGPTKIKKYLELFGWGSKTGIDLPGEVEGLVPSPEWKKRVIGEDWWDGNTYNLSIGQEYISVTPLQVATGFVAIANGGTLYKPKVVQKIVDSEKNVIEEIEPEILRELDINDKNLQVVREGMREAVTYGSSVLLNTLPVKAASKTGTAEIWKKGEKLYDTWVTVFAPYDDPQIVLTLMIEDVKDLSTLTVLPVAKEILNWYFQSF